jgi:hypothetical protein
MDIRKELNSEKTKRSMYISFLLGSKFWTKNKNTRSNRNFIKLMSARVFSSGHHSFGRLVHGAARRWGWKSGINTHALIAVMHALYMYNILCVPLERERANWLLTNPRSNAYTPPASCACTDWHEHLIMAN